MRLSPLAKKTLTGALIAASASFVAGCNPKSSGTSTGNPMTSSALVVTGSSQAAQVARHWIDQLIGTLIPSAVALPVSSISDSNGASITLSEAWIALENIEMRVEQFGESAEDLAPRGRGNNNGFSVLEGPFVVDLLSNSPLPLGDFQIEKQNYKRIKMRLSDDALIPSDAPAELSGNGIYLEGQVNGQDFSVSMAESTNFEVKGARGITPDEEHDMLVVIRIADLFKQIDMSGISSTTLISKTSRFSATNPCPNIDPSAADLYTCFRKGIEKNAKLGRDLNKDHDLDNNDDLADD